MPTDEQVERGAGALMRQPPPIGQESARDYRLRLSRAVLTAALAGGVEVPAWQSIETAPKDGTRVDLWIAPPGLSTGAGREPDCWWSAGKWWKYDEAFGDDQCRSQIWNATHWQPLPAPPAERSGGAAIAPPPVQQEGEK